MFLTTAKYFDFVERCRKAGITVPIVPGIKPVVFANQLNALPRVFRFGYPWRPLPQSCASARMMPKSEK